MEGRRAPLDLITLGQVACALRVDPLLVKAAAAELKIAVHRIGDVLLIDRDELAALRGSLAPDAPTAQDQELYETLMLREFADAS